MGRDTKLIAILRWQYHIILTALGENIFRIGLRLFATQPNTEYIFSQLAVNIMWNCRLKIAICFSYCKFCHCCLCLKRLVANHLWIFLSGEDRYDLVQSLIMCL